MNLPKESAGQTLLYNYKHFLKTKGYSIPTIKNYLTDLRHLLEWSESTFGSFHPKLLSQGFFISYRQYLDQTLSDKQSIVSRRLSSLVKFLEWATFDRLIHEDVLEVYRQVYSAPREDLTKPKEIEKEAPLHKKVLHHLRFTRPKWYALYHKRDWSTTAHYIILFLFITTLGAFFFYSYLVKPSIEQRKDLREQYGSVLPATSPPRVLSYQGRLTNNSDQPITSATNVVFRIWDQLSGGTEGDCADFNEDCLWKSKTWSVTPDSNGIFSVLLGDTGASDTAIPATLFTDYSDLYLGITVASDTEMTPRQRVASAAYALNSDALDGLDSGQFLHSFESDSFTSGTLTTDAGTTVDVNGTLAWGGATISEALNMNSQLITNIGDSGTDFTAGGALTLAGTLTLSNNTLTCTGCIETTDVSDNTVTATDLNATLTFAALDFVDLALVVHDTTALQGLRLPQAASASPSSPTSGEGFVAWDAGGNQIIVYNGSAWATIGGGSQTPWTSDIDADGFDLNDISNTLFRETTGAPTGSDVGLFRDNSGDLNLNALTGKDINLQVNGSDEYNFSSTTLNFNSNTLTNVGGYTQTSGIASITNSSLGSSTLLALSGTSTYTGDSYLMDIFSNVRNGIHTALNIAIDKNNDQYSGAITKGIAINVGTDGASDFADIINGVEVTFQALNGGVASVLNASAGFRFAPPIFSGSGELAYGAEVRAFEVADPGVAAGSTGLATGFVGLYIADLTGSTSYGIRQEGTGEKNWLAGRTTIGAAQDPTTNVELDLRGQMLIQQPSAPTRDILAISNFGFPSATNGVDAISILHGVSNASGNVIDLTPSFAGGANDTLTYNVIDIDAFSPTNASGTDTLNGINLGALTDPGSTIVSSAIKIGSGWDSDINLVNATPVITLSATDNTANMVIKDNCSSSCANAGSTPNTLFQFKDMSTNFGGLAIAGAWMSLNTYWGEEFNSFRAQCSAETVQARGDAGNKTCSTTTGDISTADVVGGTGDCIWRSVADATNGYEQINTADGNATTSCLSYIGSASANDAQLIFRSDNLPVVEMKVRPSRAATGDDDSRYFVGIGNLGADGAGTSTDAQTIMDATNDTGIYFSNCTAPQTASTCNDSTWNVSAQDAGSNPVTVDCGVAISTTQFAYMRIEVVSAGASAASIRAYVDGDVSDGISETACPAFGSPPTLNGDEWGWFVDTYADGTLNSNFNFDIDYVRIWQDDAPYTPDQIAEGTGDTQTELEGALHLDTAVENSQIATDRLGQDSEGNLVVSLTTDTKFIWKDPGGEIIAWVSSNGKTFFKEITSLVGNFNKLIFGQLAVQKDSQTAGEFTFEADETEITIASDKVKEDSLIYVTPTTKTAGLIAYIKEKKPGEGFVVGLERSIGDSESDSTASAKKTIKFNWLIVNQE